MEKKYTLSSPEVLNFFNLTEKDVDPRYAKERALRFKNRLQPDSSLAGAATYKDALLKQGADPNAFHFLDEYTAFNPTWRNDKSISAINSLTNLAQQNPNPIYTFDLNEGPLYRGAQFNSSPSIGDTLELSRFRSFTPDINSAASFVKGSIPLDYSLDNSLIEEQLKENAKKQSVLFQVQSDSPNKFNYLIHSDPLAMESEVLARPGSKYSVESKQRFPFEQIGDIDLIKLKQIYGIDPLGASLQGGVNLLKENAPGAVVGTAFSALNPEVAKAVEKNNYQNAINIVGKDVVLGAATEAGLKVAGKFAPVLNRVAAPLARIGAPAAAGTALFMQGAPGSLTDVVTRKAAQNPVSWLPSVKPNPKTDIAARASRVISNEAQYAFSQLLKGRLPYFK